MILFASGLLNALALYVSPITVDSIVQIIGEYRLYYTPDKLLVCHILGIPMYGVQDAVINAILCMDRENQIG